MKEKDLLLLCSLRANARETLTKISRNTRIPVSTIFDRLKHHEQTIIKKHTAIIDFSQLGFTTKVTTTLKVHKSDKDSIREYLVKHPNINSVYKINNGYDYQFEAVFRNIRELEEFLELIDEKFKIKTKQVYYIIEDIKREAFLTDPNTAQLVASA